MITLFRRWRCARAIRRHDPGCSKAHAWEIAGLIMEGSWAAIPLARLLAPNYGAHLLSLLGHLSGGRQ